MKIFDPRVARGQALSSGVGVSSVIMSHRHLAGRLAGLYNSVNVAQLPTPPDHSHTTSGQNSDLINFRFLAYLTFLAISMSF